MSYHQYSKIPLDHLRTYVEDCKNVADYIISVGCGDGSYEFEISNNINRNKFILVDPAPASFMDNTANDKLKINYKSVDELVLSQPEVIGKCVLLLVWPYPDSYHKFNPNITDIEEYDDKFDIKAFKLLQPVSVICMYESVDGVNGASGSIQMLEVLDNPEKFDYTCISTTRYGNKGGMGNNYPKIKWLAKKGSQVPKNKKCINLQQEATRISDIDLENEVGCIIS
jgi:hypothetical protein